MNNIAFACALQLGEPATCVDLLLSADCAPEAAHFARTFAPSSTSKAVKSWRGELESAVKSKLANGRADPLEHVEEFGGAEKWRDELERERAGPEVEQEYELEQGKRRRCCHDMSRWMTWRTSERCVTTQARSSSNSSTHISHNDISMACRRECRI